MWRPRGWAERAASNVTFLKGWVSVVSWGRHLRCCYLPQLEVLVFLHLQRREDFLLTLGRGVFFPPHTTRLKIYGSYFCLWLDMLLQPWGYQRPDISRVFFWGGVVFVFSFSFFLSSFLFLFLFCFVFAWSWHLGTMARQRGRVATRRSR